MCAQVERIQMADGVSLGFLITLIVHGCCQVVYPVLTVDILGFNLLSAWQKESDSMFS